MNTVAFAPPHAEALDIVLRMAARGWRLLPCVRRDKKPLIQDWPRRASSDADVIRKWAREHEGCNWGVATGPESGIFVIDVDGEYGENSFCSLVERHGTWSKTLTAITAHGRHFYFDWPTSGTIRNSAGKLGAGLDVRGDGGYCVIPPSTHPSGAVYEWAADLQVTSAPGWLLEAITRTTRPAVRASEIGILPEKTRNDGLTRYAGALRRKGKNQSEIEAELLAANARRCRPPLLDAEVRKIAASVSRYAPGGLDPLESAWQATKGDYGSNYEHFLAFARQLQLARPDQTIALPLKRIAALMGVHWTTVSVYRRKAVTDGLLEPAGEYIPHRRAGLYRISEKTETLTKTLTSGLVRVCGNTPSENSLVRVNSISPSESEKTSAGRSRKVEAGKSSSTPRCYVHGTEAEWWKRTDGDLVCGRCHPNPAEVRG